MPRLSKLIEKLEDRLEPKVGPWYERHKKKLPLYAALVLAGWYLYGMVLNSIRLGIASTFHKSGEEVVESIWVFDPFRNWFVIFTPFGLGATAVIALLVCLFTGTGYKWFSGYKATRDSRGFDILPDGTHGSSGFLTRKEMGEFLEVGSVSEVKGMMLGKYKKRPDDPDKYALYAAHRMVPGDNNNLLCIGAPGSGKSRGFIIPFLLGCAQRGESVFITDPKAELWEKLSPYFKEHGHYSQTRSNSQRELMQPDEILRLDRRQCIALFQGRKPALLYKLSPEELPGYSELKSCRVADYTPEWRLKEEQEKAQTAKKTAPPDVSGQEPPAPPKQAGPEDEPNPSQRVEYQLTDQGLGMVELGPDGVVGGDDEDKESPPGR